MRRDCEEIERKQKVLEMNLLKKIYFCLENIESLKVARIPQTELVDFVPKSEGVRF